MIYLDNAATSFPKPPGVWEAMENALKYHSANPGRGGHKLAVEAARHIYEIRCALAEFIHAEEAETIIFTGSATESINLALFGHLNPGDHLLISSMEHNAIARPAKHLEDQGVEVEIVPVEAGGEETAEAIKKRIKPNTRMVATLHASNVTGGVLPAAEIGAVCRAAGVAYLLDAAQTVGMMPVNVREIGADLVAFPGHKGLYGPPGVGVLYIRSGIRLRPLIYGGTGTLSESLDPPEQAPERYEAGTANTVGIAGVGAGLEFIKKTGLEQIMDHEAELTHRMMSGLRKLDEVEIHGPATVQNRMPVVSFNIGTMDASEVGYILDSVYNIAVRTGIHCAPLAHQTLGTLQRGSIRASFSYQTAEDDIDALLQAVAQIILEFKP